MSDGVRINDKQRRKIYGMARAAGLDNDALHEIVHTACGKRHISDLTDGEAECVIKDLDRYCAASAPPPQQISSRGICKAWALMYELCKLDPSSTRTVGERMCGVIRKVTARDPDIRAPFRGISAPEVNLIIETLKRYVRSAARKVHKSNGGG